MMAGFKPMCAALSLALAGISSAYAQATRILDNFDNPQGWQVTASDQVKAQMVATDGVSGKALCLNYDFNGVSGYAVLRKEIPLSFQSNFSLRMDVKGSGGANAFQVKLTDKKGENVWWHNRPEFTPSAQWRLENTRRRQVEFAWGPTTDKTLRQTDAIEMVIASGKDGGKGSLCFDNLQLVQLEETPKEWPALKWSVNQDGHSWMADMGLVREFGGLVLHWAKGHYPQSYSVEVSEDGQHWQTRTMVNQGQGGDEALYLPESEARYIRISSIQKGYFELAGMDVKELNAWSSINGFVEDVSKKSNKGLFPRGFSGEQSYWTILGVSGGKEQALMNEDGAVEPVKRGAALEPVIELNGQRITWADVKLEQSLQEGYLPIATVTWLHPQLTLKSTAFVTGQDSQSQTIVRYELRNTGSSAIAPKLLLVMRPFQVNPPTQFLNIHGGVTPLSEINWQEGRLFTAHQGSVIPLQKPSSLRYGVAQAGSLAALREVHSDVQKPLQVKDSQGFASAALEYPFTLAPQQISEVDVVLPQVGVVQVPKKNPQQWLSQQQAKVAKKWHTDLTQTQIDVPAAPQYGDTIKAAIAYILINREGNMIRPGTRSYARSWIRDGSLTSSALARVGHVGFGRTYADWFEKHLFESGKVPCCVDQRGADPVPENDAMGEYLYLLSDTYAHTQDKAWLAAKWPSIVRTVTYMDKLRAQERVLQLKNGVADERLRGLLPPSISHEGYSDKAAYSMWDNFWGIAGYRNAYKMAMVLGKTKEAQQFADSGRIFEKAVADSIAAVQKHYGTKTIPGAADRGDLDPTSATVAFTPTGAASILRPEDLKQTWEAYWQSFTKRQNGTDWDAYTPYEWRNVGALLRLGERERAHKAADYFMADRRPQGWKQWAEVVDRQYRHPRYLGDMPHGWVSSDFIRATLDMFAYENDDGTIILGAGILPKWLAQGVNVKNIHLHAGSLSYSIKRERQSTQLKVTGKLRSNPKGILLHLAHEPTDKIRINHQTASCWQDKEITIKRLPAVVTIEHQACHR